jgi:hypothetical protein
VAVLLPQSYFLRKSFPKRLQSLIFFQKRMSKARIPLLLALFSPTDQDLFEVWLDDIYLGTDEELRKMVPAGNNIEIRSQVLDGPIGLVGCDSWSG